MWYRVDGTHSPLVNTTQAAAVDGCRQVAGESATHAVEAARSATVDDARREAMAAASLAADRLFTEQRASILQDASKAAAQLAASAALNHNRGESGRGPGHLSFTGEDSDGARGPRSDLRGEAGSPGGARHLKI